jgi:hypothetical protein
MSMTKDQKKLVAEVDAIHAEWHEASGERKGELQARLEEIKASTEHSEALGARAEEQRLRAVDDQQTQELLARATVAGVDPDHLAAADAAIKSELDARSEVDANAQDFRQISDFCETHGAGAIGYSFALATAYAAGGGKPKKKKKAK